MRTNCTGTTGPNYNRSVLIFIFLVFSSVEAICTPITRSLETPLNYLILLIIAALLPSVCIIIILSGRLKKSRIKSEQKDKEIEERNTTIADLNKELVQNKLKRAKEESAGTNKLNSIFLANISHEVRTPLNSVIGFSNLLLADDLTKEAKEEYIEHINHNSEKLLQIIGDLIDLSRLESSHIEISYEETSINNLLTRIVEDARKQIKRNEKPIFLSVRNELTEGNDMVFTDQLWLKRVLTHLIDNAIKFTLEGTIDVYTSKEGDDLLFRIKDTGIGINKNNLDNIFEGFRQEMNGNQRPFEGLGIGLTLAKEVIERMGGMINVISEKGLGSEFYFTIPYRPAGSPKVFSRLSENNSLNYLNA